MQNVNEVHLPRDEDIDDEELVKLHHFTAAELTTCWAL